MRNIRCYFQVNEFSAIQFYYIKMSVLCESVTESDTFQEVDILRKFVHGTSGVKRMSGLRKCSLWPSLEKQEKHHPDGCSSPTRARRSSHPLDGVAPFLAWIRNRSSIFNVANCLSALSSLRTNRGGRPRPGVETTAAGPLGGRLRRLDA